MTPLSVHIFSSLLSYALFALAGIVSCLYLHRERLIKSKQIKIASSRSISLHQLDRTLLAALIVGFILLSIALPTGIYVSSIKYKGQGVLSMRLFMPVVIWILYSVLLGLRLVKGVRGRKLARSAVYGFGCAVLSSFYELYAVTS